MLDDEFIEQSPDEYLNAIGSVFAVFGENTQHSENFADEMEVSAR